MKITKIDAHCLSSPLEHPFAFSQGWVNERTCTLIEVQTDQGLTGWGEAFNQGLEPPQISAAAVRHAFAPLLVGEDPTMTEVLWHRMYHQSRDFGRKGAVMAAISGVDTALWDITGQAWGKPVYELLGGAFRQDVQPYATGFYRLKGQGEADRLADEAREHLANGFRAMKIKLGYGVEDDIRVMNAIGRALEGEQVELMVDTNHGYGYADALRLGRALEPFKLRWYEEPVVPEDLASYARLRDQLSMPIAGGENEHSLYGFRALLEQQCVDVAQPDIGSCGGITAARHIWTFAQAHGVAVNPHVWGSAVAQMASLQVLAALPVTHHGLFSTEPILEYDQSEHPFRQDLIDESLAIRSGRVRVPDRPGLGLTINRHLIDRFKLN